MLAVTAKQMKMLEAAAAKRGISQEMLMRGAGEAAANCIVEMFDVRGKHCLVFCGKGNNGGDGFVVAAELKSLGAAVAIVLVEGLPKNALPKKMMREAQADGIEILDYTVNNQRVLELLATCDCVIDAIYGTGFRGELSEEAASACNMMNHAIAAVVSLDIPSGIETDSGNGDIACVKADFTIAFDCMKPAHLLMPASSQCGQVRVVDIGIPPELHNMLDVKLAVIDEDMVRKALPVKEPDSHKGDHGRLLIIAGSEQYPGAAMLATSAAIHSGVGICELATVPYVSQVCAIKMNEPIHLPLYSNDEGRLSSATHEALDEAMGKASAILIGPGLGLDEDIRRFVAYVLRTAEVPVIVDADGLNALAGQLEVLEEAKVPLVLTPHLGELSRLTGKSIEELKADPYELVGQFSEEHHVIVVAKSHRTFVAPAGIGAYLNTTGNAGLAKGGSGDVLAGLIASLTAQGMNPLQAAACGVWIHGKAGDLAEAEYSKAYMTPTDVIGKLAPVFQKLGR